MTWLHVCDVCGEDIERWQGYVTLLSERKASSKPNAGGWIGHYHDGKCFQRVHSAIDLVHDVAATLDALPTVSRSAVEKQRRQHIRAASEETGVLEIGELDLSMRTFNALRRAGIYTVSDLRARIEAYELMAVAGIGRKALKEIQAALDDLSERGMSPDHPFEGRGQGGGKGGQGPSGETAEAA